MSGDPIEVEVWSDVMCPFCYLGKQRFARALEEFPHPDRVRVTWRSFQLDPSLRTDLSLSTSEYLARRKGLGVADAERMNEQLAQVGAREGLTYRFDKVRVSNTFMAHRFLHFARVHGRQDEAMERLFRAHFAEGQNVDDPSALVALGQECGLDAGALSRALAGDAHAGDVNADVAEARLLGISGVPFFVFDRKYAVSGAQEPAAFLAALTKVWEERDDDAPSSH